MIANAVRRGSSRDASVFALYLAAALTVLSAHLVFEILRLGYLRRQRRTKSDDARFALTTPDQDPPHVTILIPAYMEEPDVVARAVLSAALQTYPACDVVVLLDDAPFGSGDDRVRNSVSETAADLSRLGEFVAQARRDFYRAFLRNRTDDEPRRLADVYDHLADALIRLEPGAPVFDHTGRCFTRAVLAEPADLFRANARRLIEHPDVGVLDIEETYDRLISWLTPRISVFQRKAFANLSHSPSKASNLNTYLNLAPGPYAFTHRGGVPELRPVNGDAEPDFVVCDATYVMNLDADSFVRPGYVSTLVEILEQHGHEKLAIAQTPYRAIQGSASQLERIAGATTDMQYIAHLGLAHFGAAFWVGANAIMRRSALDDIATLVADDPEKRRRFIRERTVIEDSDATVDLLRCDWKVYNHSEPMAFSATPADFGSLAIQRRRWANGGLIILRTLETRTALAQARVRIHAADSLPHVHCRHEYMRSIARRCPDRCIPLPPRRAEPVACFRCLTCARALCRGPAATWL